MTSKEIRAAIGRLRSQHDDSFGYSLSDVADALLGESHGMGVASSSKLRDAIISLLEQADPESCVELPMDANGVPIRIGDEMDFSEGVRGLTVLGIGTSDAHDGDMGVFVLDDDGYTWFNARFLRHHRPTVKEVLRMFLAESEDAMRKGYDEVPDPIYVRYADKMRKAVEEER
jgi:hypothetical protein